MVLDLGRRPEARFLGTPGGEYLREAEVTEADLRAAEAAVGAFGRDNRAGVAGTLHRVSAMRNRRGSVVGLTCRVGRAVSGHADMIRDLVESECDLVDSVTWLTMSVTWLVVSVAWPTVSVTLSIVIVTW